MDLSKASTRSLYKPINVYLCRTFYNNSHVSDIKRNIFCTTDNSRVFLTKTGKTLFICTLRHHEHFPKTTSFQSHMQVATTCLRKASKLGEDAPHQTSPQVVNQRRLSFKTTLTLFTKDIKYHNMLSCLQSSISVVIIGRKIIHASKKMETTRWKMRE